MKNVTITLDGDVARWARLRAAELGTSLSRLVGDLLRERMLEEQGYQAALAKFLGRRPRRLKKGDGYPQREELHERAALR